MTTQAEIEFILARTLTPSEHTRLRVIQTLEATEPTKRKLYPKRGAGGLARAHQVSRLRERCSDGTFMAHKQREQIERETAEQEYMRYAAGGFARAAKARRNESGKFVATNG